MTLRLDYLPIQTSYGAEVHSNITLESDLPGGLARKRQDVDKAVHIVQCTWLVPRDEYDLFMGFFRTTLKNGSLPFLLDLVTDIGIPTTHKCRTIGGEPKLIRQSGDGYWVQGTLQAEANPTQTGFVHVLERFKNWFFDGVNDNALVGDFHHFERTQPITLSAWFRSTTSVNSPLIGNARNDTTARGYVFYNRTTTPAGLMLELNNNSNLSSNGVKVYIPTSTIDLLDGVEHHVAATYSGNSNASGVKLYVDGVVQTTTTFQNNLSATIVPAAGTTNLRIGGRDSGNFHNEYLRHVSIWTVEMTDSQVTELYNSGRPGNLLAHTAAASLQSWYKFDNDDTLDTNGITDYGPSGHDATALNGLGTSYEMVDEVDTSTAELIKYQSSISSWQFDGINDTITMGDVHDKAAGVPFSVSGWFATRQGGGTFSSEARLFAKRGASGNFSGWGVLFTNSNAQLVWAFGGPDSGGARRSEIFTTLGWADGELHNFVCTKSAVNTTTGLKIYVDGALQPTGTNFNTFAGSPLNAVSLAIDQDGLFKGLLQHMAIWNKELSASEVTEIYNDGIPGDLLATSMAANLEGWWKVDGTDSTGASGVIDHSVNNNHGTAAGGLGGSLGYHIVYPDIAINYAPGDFLRIIDSNGTHPTDGIDLNLDGTYEVDATLGRNNIRLVTPELTNTDWYKLYAIDEDYGDVDSGNVISTITKVPT